MGQTSEYAEGLLGSFSYDYDMSCQLAVQYAEGKFKTARFTYGSGPLVHVEDMLLHQLDEWWGYANIPPGSKIIFYANWSPCKHCIQNTIPNALNKMNVVENNLRIRFRFNEYYTAQAWNGRGKNVRKESGGHYFWESQESAESAYEALASIYGRCGLKDLSTPTQVKTSVSPRVAFIRGQSRSRTLTTWHESWRGKIS